MSETYVLTVSCANRPGIVAAVANALFEEGRNILDAQQFDDIFTNRFFMRMVFDG
ncbi:MAG: ACT domain-containing protein [Methylobacterium sp.]|nr:ACT domain-containing protein [Methylobacterium sp.]MCA3639240.1 ACT domain-containing protein [Methylobacterium sp.]